MWRPEVEAAVRESLPVHTVDALKEFPSKSYSDFLDAERQCRIEVLTKYDPGAVAVLASGTERAFHNFLAWGPFIVMGADVVAAATFRSFWVLLGVPLAFLGMLLSVPGFMRSTGIWLNRGLTVLVLYLWVEGRLVLGSLVASYLVANFFAHAGRSHCRLVFLKAIARSELALVWLFRRGSVVPVHRSSQ